MAASFWDEGNYDSALAYYKLAAKQSHPTAVQAVAMITEEGSKDLHFSNPVALGARLRRLADASYAHAEEH